MAAGADGSGEESKTHNIEGPTRPTEIRQPTTWPEGQSMSEQQGAANTMFQRNSERLQQSAEAKHEGQNQTDPQKSLSFAKDGGRGNYADLKQPQQGDKGNEQSAGHDAGQRQLSFAKDRAPGHYAELKQGQPDGKDAGQSQTQGAGEGKSEAGKDGPGREQGSPVQGQAKEAGKELTFAKDNSHGQSLGR